MQMSIDVYHGNDYVIKCLSILLQLELCNMFKVISDILAHWDDM